MVNGRRRVGFTNGDQVVETDQLIAVVAYKKCLQVIRFITVDAGYLAHYLVLFSIFCKIAQPAVTIGQLQGL